MIATRLVMSAALGLAVIASSSFDAAVAHAETPPSSWQIARDPAARERWALHVKVRELMATPPSPLSFARLRDRDMDRARLLLEAADAANSPDVVLRFDLGEVYEDRGMHEEAMLVLKEALKMAPRHPASQRAWLALAYAAAHLDRPEQEREAYEHYLAMVLDDGSKAVAVLNLAEAEMRLGHLEEAVAGYREAVRLSNLIPNTMSSDTGILAVWGLAVALDRAGDPRGASLEAQRASSMDPNRGIIGDTLNVFFVPAYERFWYLALGSTEDARSAADPVRQVLHWRRAEQLWKAYVAAAEKAGPKERWLALAKAHLARAIVERKAAEHRAGNKLPAQVPERIEF